ncbi:conserved hypothetical protein [Ricinus communis]|uniref:Uncharacterized protein n=1 Tax=Ricinus communis TaxID=3988 RepID=B9R9Y7_RICCO|nr:conserved hypothetical protein [Ricinus communis]
MAFQDERSTLESIRQHLLTDFASMDSFISDLDNFIKPERQEDFDFLQPQQHQEFKMETKPSPRSSTLSQRKPAMSNIAIPPPATLKAAVIQPPVQQAEAGRQAEEESWTLKNHHPVLLSLLSTLKVL